MLCEEGADGVATSKCESNREAEAADAANPAREPCLVAAVAELSAPFPLHSCARNSVTLANWWFRITSKMT